MQPFDLADAGVGIGLIGMLLGVYLLYEKW